ncbi:SDR family NAD(P)-dependent oxidoreductase [Streptomyces sp. NBC_00464]|uniref:SDR family NAD(P)-dependent oxidoreductase n=1 Tax=Streptomyces sp. NBC_00464 TaxID=2975751 RepID=UPI002E188F9A
MALARALETHLRARPLQGRTALVTGGATGIGAGIGRALSTSGATVAVNHPGQGREARAFLATLERGGSPGVAIDADLTDRDAVQRALRIVHHWVISPRRRRLAAALRPSTSKEKEPNDRTSPSRSRHRGRHDAGHPPDQARSPRVLGASRRRS